MSFRDLLADTIGTLWAHKRRTFLTMFGIAWGIVSITLMMAAGEGMHVGLVIQQQTFGKDVIIFFTGRTSMQAGGTRSGRATQWKAGDYLQVQKESPACKYVMPELGNDLQTRTLYNSGTISTVGSLPEFTQIRSIEVLEGRFYSNEDNAEGRRVAFLGSDAKKQLFAERRAVGETIWLNGVPYTVIGTMKPKDQNSSYDGFDKRKIFLPFNPMLRDFPSPPPAEPDDVPRILVAPWSLATHVACVRQVRATLARLHNFDPRDQEATPVWDTVKGAEATRLIFDGMAVFLGAVGVATLFLGGISVMNVMLVSVRERTREIGLRMALGATRRSILRQFFLETVIVALISGTSGLTIAYGLCWLVDLFPMPRFFAGMLTSWKLGVFSIALLGTVAVLSGVYPATRAAEVDPIEALRFEAGG
jgi:putative ABC transport system permease protein